MNLYECADHWSCRAFPADLASSEADMSKCSCQSCVHEHPCLCMHSVEHMTHETIFKLISVKLFWSFNITDENNFIPTFSPQYLSRPSKYQWMFNLRLTLSLSSKLFLSSRCTFASWTFWRRSSLKSAILSKIKHCLNRPINSTQCFKKLAKWKSNSVSCFSSSFLKPVDDCGNTSPKMDSCRSWTWTFAAKSGCWISMATNCLPKPVRGLKQTQSRVTKRAAADITVDLGLEVKGRNALTEVSQ